MVHAQLRLRAAVLQNRRPETLDLPQTDHRPSSSQQLCTSGSSARTTNRGRTARAAMPMIRSQRTPNVAPRMRRAASLQIIAALVPYGSRPLVKPVVDIRDHVPTMREIELLHFFNRIERASSVPSRAESVPANCVPLVSSRTLVSWRRQPGGWESTCR
jgi:hypothetical protein